MDTDLVDSASPNASPCVTTSPTAAGPEYRRRGGLGAKSVIPGAHGVVSGAAHPFVLGGVEQFGRDFGRWSGSSVAVYLTRAERIGGVSVALGGGVHPLGLHGHRAARPVRRCRRPRPGCSWRRPAWVDRQWPERNTAAGRVEPSIASTPGCPTAGVDPTRTDCGRRGSDRLGPGTQFVDDVEHRLGGHAARRSVMSIVTPGPLAATVPIRIDSAAGRARALSTAAWSGAEACNAASWRCRSGPSVFSPRPRAAAGTKQRQRIGRRAVSGRRRTRSVGPGSPGASRAAGTTPRRRAR